MSNEPNNALINFGDLSKPADTLIKKVSKAVGGVFAPYQMKRMAKAEAEVAIIKAQSEIQITDLHRRALHRFVEEEALRQKNIEDITNKAIPHLSDKSDAEKMDDDWVMNFFDKSRIVSDEDMQGLWSKVLAGEANLPGTYSKRTVNLLGDLDKSDAASFMKLCSFGWFIGNVVPLIFDIQDDIYAQQGVTFSSLSHLESIGLVQFNSLTGFNRLKLPKVVLTAYYGDPLLLQMPKDTDNEPPPRPRLTYKSWSRIGSNLWQPSSGWVHGACKEEMGNLHPKERPRTNRSIRQFLHWRSQELTKHLIQSSTMLSKRRRYGSAQPNPLQ